MHHAHQSRSDKSRIQHARWSVDIKMFRASLLFFAFSIASRDCAIIPDLPNSGSAGFHADLNHRNAQFGEGIRDWFRNMKDKVFGTDSSNQINLPSPMDLNSGRALKLYTNNVPERMIIQPGKFFLDLTNYKFNPDTDWGFHVGNWYIIRRFDSDDVSSFKINNWSYWKDLFDLKDENSSEEEDSDEQKVNTGSSATSTTIRVAETSVNIAGDKEGNENSTSAIEDLSVEVLKPSA